MTGGMAMEALNNSLKHARATEVAVDLRTEGNELVLSEPERIPLPGFVGRHYVTIQYLEVPVGRNPSLAGEPEFSRVREAVRLELSSTNPGAGHGCKSPGRSGCGQSHALCLATVSRHGTHWRVAPAKRSVLHRT